MTVAYDNRSVLASHRDGVVEIVLPSADGPGPIGRSPRAANAAANGEPMTKLPLVGSPSARSMTVCANRSTSVISPDSILTAIGQTASPTVSVGSPIDSISAIVSDASCHVSRTRACIMCSSSSPAMPMASDALSSACAAQLPQFLEAGAGDVRMDPTGVAAYQGAGCDAHRQPVGVVGRAACRRPGARAPNSGAPRRYRG